MLVKPHLERNYAKTYMDKFVYSYIRFFYIDTILYL